MGVIGNKVAGKNNTYEVISHCVDDSGERVCQWVKLRCIDFYDVDDLGDKMYIRKVGEECWVANYHFQQMAVLR